MKTVEENEPKRWTKGRIVAAVVLLLLPILYFAPVIFGGMSLLPGDGLSQNLGVRVLIGQMLRSGQLPLWNPYILAGAPLLASVYPGALYPPNWVFALFSPATAMNIVVVTTYHLALIGAYLYGRRIGLTRIAAIVAGMAFAFGGFMVAHLGHTSRIAAAVWLPWLLLAIENCYANCQFAPLRQSDGLAQTDSPRNDRLWLWIVFGAAFIALQLFAGEPQMNFYAGLVCGAYAIFTLLFRMGQGNRGRFLIGLLVMAVCGALLSMIQLLPERELLKMGERAGISYEYFSGYSFPPANILTFIFPFFFGGGMVKPFKEDYWSGSTLDEAAGYFGLLTLLLALAAVIGTRFNGKEKRSLVWFWSGAAVVSLVLAFGAYLPFNLNYALYHTPVYNLFRASGRHMYDFTFSLAMLAGLGASFIAQADRETAKRIFKPAALIFVVMVVLTTIAYRFFGASLALPTAPSAIFNSLANPEALVPLIAAVFSVITLWIYVQRRDAIAGSLLVLMLFVDLAAFSLIFNYGWRDYVSNINQRLEDPPAVKFIKSREADLNAFRIVSHSFKPHGNSYHELDFPNVSIARGLQSVNGYDALRLLRQSAIAGDMGWDGVIQDNNALGSNHRGFDLLNAKYLLYEKASQSDYEQALILDGVTFNREPVFQTFTPGSTGEVKTGSVAATELVLVTLMANSTHVPDNTAVLKIKLHTKDGRVIEQELHAGRDTAEWAYDKPEVKAVIKHRRPKVAESEPAEGFAANRFLARLPFDRAEIESFGLEYVLPDASLLILRASLFDVTTGKSYPLDVTNFFAKRWHKLEEFGSVTVYENAQFRPRAWFVRRLAIGSSDEVLQTIKSGRLKDGGLFDPAETALFEKEDFGNRRIDVPQLQNTAGDATKAEANVTRFEPNRLEIATRNPQDGVLVLSEIYYRGWEAWIDGKRVPVEKVNYTLRGLFVPAGEHRVEFVYRAHSFRNGAAWSLMGVLLLLVVGVAERRNHSSDNDPLASVGARLGSLTRAQLLAIAMLGLLGIYTAVLAKQASHAVGGSDSSGYARMARSLLEGRVKLPIEELEKFGVPADYAPIFTPLAYTSYRNGDALSNLMTPFYPIGFPLHLAAGAAIFGWLRGPFWVCPLLGALSLLLLYLTARQLGLSRTFAYAGVLLLAVNPTFIFMASQPMSDVAALFWASVLVWAGLRSRQKDGWALLAGVAFGAAFLVRPTNILLLAPLAFCLRLKPKTLLFFALGGLPMAAIFLGYNYAAYGHPLQTGYGSINLQESITAVGFAARFKDYAYWLVMTLSPVLILGWLAVAVNRRVEWRDRTLLILWFAAFLIFYGCYSIYGAWWYTRFLLPAYPALILGALLTARDIFARLEDHRLLLRIAGAASLAVALGFACYQNRAQGVFNLRQEQTVHPDSCRWADARLPAQSVIVASQMSGALKFYTDRLIFRWDMLPSELWPSLKERIQERGYQFYALLMEYELADAQRNVLGEWSELGHVGNVTLWRIKPLDKAPPAVNYVQGFSDAEHDPLGTTWRWMGNEGVVQLENTGRAMRLRIEGEVPVDDLSQPATFKILFNGKLLEQAVIKQKTLQKEFVITPAQQGGEQASELRILTDQVFIPSQRDPRNTDERRLGFSLTKLVWEEPPMKP